VDAERQRRSKRRVWLFDLDDTLHDASHAAMRSINEAMTAYVATHLGLPSHEASALRVHYWKRYGATMLGLIRHHGVKASHFLEETHKLPGLEGRLRTHAHDRAALKRLPGRKYILTNAPREYALRVLNTLHLAEFFDGVISVEDMTMFGHHRPKPDARMLRHVAVRLKVPPSRCVLVEDTLQHQRAAHGIGMTAVWMRRYAASASRLSRSIDRNAARCTAGHSGGASIPNTPEVAFSNVKKALEVGVHRCTKPPYVRARIGSLKTLRSL
jgi:putative hydrolase of the HAD superfamily